MIFVDSNIPMYLVGGEHPNKSRAGLIIEREIASGQVLVTDAEVFQEILHRYVSIDRREAIDPAFQVLLDLIDDVFAVDMSDVIRASQIAQRVKRISARDAIHVATMERHAVRSILSFDSDFDDWPSLHRIFQ
ncbi:MAG: type II toxin-antitoxin system VapC family toxin [Bryobacteraceae bacterium]